MKFLLVLGNIRLEFCMCTVSFIPTVKGFYLTSSRDEKSSRVTLPPNQYGDKGDELFFPKDEKAGGTWIAASINGRIACLLNGAFVNHVKMEHHTKSRGKILIESFQNDNILEFIEEVSLENVEPFTLLLLDYKNGELRKFYELRWDGKTKHYKNLPHKEPQIWSSATLYNSTVQALREQLFKEWLENNKDACDNNILNFHNGNHGLKRSQAILMEREGGLKTISISQMNVHGHGTTFDYFDLVMDKKYKIILHNDLKSFEQI